MLWPKAVRPIQTNTPKTHTLMPSKDIFALVLPAGLGDETKHVKLGQVS